jgi:two-component system response regulator FixJ
MQERIIHLVDDEEAVRRSAGFMLRTSGFKVHTYVSGVEFLSEVKHLEPGCILLDVRMPGMDGLEVQAELNQRGIAMPVIVLTGHGDINTAVVAMKAGASDFIEKPFEMEVLTQAIEIAFMRLDAGAAASSHRHVAQVRIAALSRREQDVLHGLVAGRPNKLIAYDLGISPRTVEVYRAALMSKLGVRSLSEALRIAFAAGMIGEIAPVSSQAGDTT